MSFNHNNENQILLNVFYQQSQISKNKSQQHVVAILNAFRKHQENTPLTLKQFVQLSEISNCKGDPREITSFMTHFLKFNEYG